MIRLQLPGPDDAALLVSRSWSSPTPSPHATEAYDFRQLAHDLSDALDQLPTPHHGDDL